MILQELQAVMPSFVARVERPDRGGQWIGYLESRAEAGARWARRLGLDEETEAATGPSVRLTHVDGDEDDLLAALLFEASSTSEDAIRRSIEALSEASAPSCSPISSASAPTAATVPGGALRRCATASRSSPTTAPSATCSATGCSPCSGRR